ncbi:uncharacterized protein LOC109827561 [Asparagus officinalis]|uniref:uncharacterized protein LOC109827561 n=1 Tax=Asparagus officinalis TaxID=4686 RepID=UPI00098E349B|nr:uncharacterized protein LOC109827561 [Asparagus officinalis]
MTKGLRKKALERLFGRHSGGDAQASTLGGGDATHDSQPQDTSRRDAPHDVETHADPTQHAEIPLPPHADVLEERRFEPYSTALEAAALPPDSITNQRVHGPTKVKGDWDSYHALRPIAQYRYEQAKHICLELKGTGRPPRRDRNATKEMNLIPDINRRARIDALVRFFFLDNNICAWTFFFTLCDYWDTTKIQAQAEIARRNRNAPRSYENHGSSRSFSQHYHQLELEGRGDLRHFVDRILTPWSPNYADEEKKAKNKDLAEKLHAKVQEQLTQSQVCSNTHTRLSREEEDSIIETIIGPSRKNRYRWRGSEQRPHESSSTYKSAAPQGTPGSSSYQDLMEQRLKVIEDWQSQQTTYQWVTEEERRRQEQTVLEFTQFMSTLPQEAQEAYRRWFMSSQAGTSSQGAAGGSHNAAGLHVHYSFILHAYWEFPDSPGVISMAPTRQPAAPVVPAGHQVDQADLAEAIRELEAQNRQRDE